MWKYVVIFLLCLAIFLIIGFVVTFLLIPKTSTTPIPNFNHPSLASETAIQNILLIHVDNLSAPKPTLVSVWAVMVRITDKPRFFFQMLSPSEPGNSDNLKKSFSINRELELNPDFIHALTEFPAQWQGYILVDNSTVNKFMVDMGISSQPLNNVAAHSPEQIDALYQLQRNIFINICSRSKRLVSLASQKISPFKSDPAAPVLISNLQAIIGSENLICEIPPNR